MSIAEFSPVSALLGGALIGLAATLLLLSQGRIAGISGILGGLVTPGTGDVSWRAAFILSMVLAGVAFDAISGPGLAVELQSPLGMMLAAGFLVGLGTRVGSGCTSGHGVCGIARLSPRSIVATITFMLAGAVTVYIVRHVVGGSG